MSIKVNGNNRQFKKIAQIRIPNATSIFNLLTYMLSVLINRAKDDDQIIRSHLIAWKIDCLSCNTQITQFYQWSNPNLK